MGEALTWVKPGGFGHGVRQGLHAAGLGCTGAEMHTMQTFGTTALHQVSAALIRSIVNPATHSKSVFLMGDV